MVRLARQGGAGIGSRKLVELKLGAGLARIKSDFITEPSSSVFRNRLDGLHVNNAFLLQLTN